MSELSSPNAKRAPIRFDKSPFKAVVFGPEERTDIKLRKSSHKREREDMGTDELMMFKRVRVLSRKTRVKRGRNDASPFSSYVKVNALVGNSALQNSKTSVERTGSSSGDAYVSFGSPTNFGSPASFDALIGFAFSENVGSQTPNNLSDSDSDNSSDDSDALDKLPESNGLIKPKVSADVLEESDHSQVEPEALFEAESDGSQVESEPLGEADRPIKSDQTTEVDDLAGRDIQIEPYNPIHDFWIQSRSSMPMTWTESLGWVGKIAWPVTESEQDLNNHNNPSEHQSGPQTADPMFLNAAANGDREAVSTYLSSVLEKGEWMSPEAISTVTEGFEELITANHIDLVQLCVENIPRLLMDKAYVNRIIRIAAESSQIYILYMVLRHQLRCLKYRGSSTPLHLAASLNQTAAVRLLLQHGADAHSIDTNDQTPLQVALATGHTKVARMLEEAEREREERQKSWETLWKSPWPEAPKTRGAL